MKIQFSSRQKKCASLLIAILSLTLGFQNCSSSLQGVGTVSNGVASLSSESSSGDGSIPVVDPSQDAKNRLACAANFNIPTFTSVSADTVSTSSGLGPASGDSMGAARPTLTFKGVKNIINSSVESASTCATYTTMTARCTVLVDDSHPANFTQAIGPDGGSLLNMNGSNKGKSDLAGMSMDLNNCNDGVLAAGSSTVRIDLNRNGNDPFARCVEGSAYVKVVLRTTVNMTSKDSDAKYVKVNFVNTCWNESRLKMNTEYPRISGVGAAAAIDGNWAVALADNEVMGSVTGVGALHIFNFDGLKWVYHSTLQPSDAQVGDSLTSVAIKGSTLIATSAFRSGTGAALVYKLQGNSWVQAQTLVPSNGQAGQMFGKSVSYDGTTLVVGAPGYSRSGADKAGLVYIYAMSGSNFGAPVTIEVPDAAYANKGFGSSVSVSGSNIAVGSPQALTKESLGKGDVRVFNSSGGWHQVTLKTPGTEVSDNVALKYGASVALAGQKLVIGVPGCDGGMGNTNSGAAVYFSDFMAGNPTKVWKANELNAVFGTAVAIGSAGVFVGGPKIDNMQGYAEYYDFTSLALKYRIISYNRAPNDQLGFSLAVSGNNLMIGSRVKDDSQVDSGAAYIYIMK